MVRNKSDIKTIQLKDGALLVELREYFKKYIKKSLSVAVEEYKLDSAFNSFQPQCILSLYKKELRKFGVRATGNNYFQKSVRDNEAMEDALSMAADISALFVLKNDFLFSRNIINESRAILNREDQHFYEDYLLGFGYFLKSICFNGKYAMNAIMKWVEEKDEEIFDELIISDIRICTNGKGDIDRQKSVVSVKFPFSVATRTIRMCGNESFPNDFELKEKSNDEFTLNEERLLKYLQDK